jgi:hypothetical protein
MSNGRFVSRTLIRGDITGLLDRQEGVVRRDQVVGTCVSDGSLRWLLERGQWQAVLPSIFLCNGGAPTERQRMAAAVLYGGSGAVITGPTALRLHGLRYVPPDDRVHILVPQVRRPRSVAFVVVQRTLRVVDEPCVDSAVHYAPIARAIADTAVHGHDLRTVRAFVSEAVQRRLTTPQCLALELRERRRNGSGVFRQVVSEVMAGVRSAPEAEFKDIIDATNLGGPVLWNPVLWSPTGERLPTPDAWIDDVGIAIEIDSREYHATPDGWSRTLQRHNVLAGHGVLVLHFTPAEIRSTPETVRRRVVAAYLARKRQNVRVDLRAGDQRSVDVARAASTDH